MDTNENEPTESQYQQLLEEACQLLKDAPITSWNTISNPEWRKWVKDRKDWLQRTQLLLEQKGELSDEPSRQDIP